MLVVYQKVIYLYSEIYIWKFIFVLNYILNIGKKQGLDTLLFSVKHILQGIKVIHLNPKIMAVILTVRGTYLIIDNHQVILLLVIFCMPSSADTILYCICKEITQKIDQGADNLKAKASYNSNFLQIHN